MVCRTCYTSTYSLLYPNKLVHVITPAKLNNYAHIKFHHETLHSYMYIQPALV